LSSAACEPPRQAGSGPEISWWRVFHDALAPVVLGLRTALLEVVLGFGNDHKVSLLEALTSEAVVAASMARLSVGLPFRLRLTRTKFQDHQRSSATDVNLMSLSHRIGAVMPCPSRKRRSVASTSCALGRACAMSRRSCRIDSFGATTLERAIPPARYATRWEIAVASSTQH
jgi:hypothetical protein